MYQDLKIYNTLSGKKEVLKPLKNKKINMFVCGPTVYDFSHIGHARTYIIFDCFVKYLQHVGFSVFYLQNITDIDDKIILRAKEKGVLPKDLAEAFTKEHLKDMKRIGVDSVNKYSRATDYVKEIINQVQRLMSIRYAYKLNDGIYFNVAKDKKYGKLSGRTALQAEDAISRIDYSKEKINRGDFCVWKFSEDHKGEPSWPSPFGKGRPGWHIEDTAMTEKFFGPQYDIHGGARDLIFPHHEAEIALMESISRKKPLAKYWMHTGFLTIEDQKMSKSLNNFITINNFLERYSCEQLRFWVARNLWRSPMNYSESTMLEVRSALEKMYEFLRKIKEVKSNRRIVTDKKLKTVLKRVQKNFYKNLNDDFNTPKAFAVIFDFIREVNPLLDAQAVTKKDANDIYKFFEEMNDIFNIIDFKKIKQSNVPDEVKKLVKERETYRKSGEWEKSDHIRKEIEKYGYIVDDTKEGPVLKKV